jgi:glycosyltransferase involved in cell wall biosynthesis
MNKLRQAFAKCNNPNMIEGAFMGRPETLPLVSAVIPTRNRPELVCRAVRSALNQTYPNIEVVVVIDGPDPVTLVALGAFQGSNVRVVPLPESVGGGSARNLGVREAKGEWVALLDDDDEWLPAKIEKQMAAAAKISRNDVLVASQYFRRFDTHEIIHPGRFPRPHQPISEYLFCEVPLLRDRVTFLSTSTWLLRRQFMLEVPFDPSVRMNDDSDWLLQAIHDTDAQLHILHEPLAIYHSEASRLRMGTDPKELEAGAISRKWAMRRRSMFTRKALSYFFVTLCLPAAVRGKLGVKTYADILSDCWRYGSISLAVLWFSFRAVFLFPLIYAVTNKSMIGFLQRITTNGRLERRG